MNMHKIKSFGRWIAVTAIAAAAFAGTAFAKTKVACIGDSLTEGYLVGAGESYPAKLQNVLGSGYEVQNFGVTSSYVIDDGVLIYRKTDAYSKSLAYDADILVFMFGSNDVKAYDWTPTYFKNQYMELIDSYRAAAKSHGKEPKIYICVPPESRDSFFGVQRKAVDPTFLVAQAENAVMLDSYHLTLGHPEYYLADQLHLTGEAYQKFAEFIGDAIRNQKTGVVFAPEETIRPEVAEENARLLSAQKLASAMREQSYAGALAKLYAERPDWEIRGVVDD